MSDSYCIYIPVNVVVRVPRNEYDALTMFNHDSYLEQKVREQVNLYGNEMHISVDDLNYADLVIELD